MTYINLEDVGKDVQAKNLFTINDYKIAYTIKANSEGTKVIKIKQMPID
jgi:hypothetical protein